MPSKPNPFTEIERMFDRMSRQFESLDPMELSGTFSQIAVDIVEEDDQFVVTADLPGFEKEHIDVSLPDETRLRIDADQESDVEREEERDGGRYVRRERRRKSASRTVTLPAPVAESDTSATYQNGVLTITLPKAEPEESGGQSIPVN